MQTSIQVLTDDAGKEATYYFNENGIMQTGKIDLFMGWGSSKKNQTWYFHARVLLKGQDTIRESWQPGLFKRPASESWPGTPLRGGYRKGEKRYLINTSNNIQKASPPPHPLQNRVRKKVLKTLKIQMILSGQLTVQESSSNILISSVHKYHRRPSWRNRGIFLSNLTFVLLMAFPGSFQFCGSYNKVNKFGELFIMFLKVHF